ncbi:hypothetical protein CEUSTIGMA_g3880.t1 [Chlamydomonas eustigma]|uniref:Expansin-like EG45 domain-containing protein n=1 Tax=Chlamydomonas eustigma TaxID=1157962 RepID=A0A250X059_9CHLO|nr:hypothetical protein CEUSTIGMA_g3880.t1 [Chlamydomonas eustigma]|eukprot:GAX76435.1 hypothetical protein CEUSTIGMA_g3880.t1 [Chlamydomonas eustigma]
MKTTTGQMIPLGMTSRPLGPWLSARCVLSTLSDHALFRQQGNVSAEALHFVEESPAMMSTLSGNASACGYLNKPNMTIYPFDNLVSVSLNSVLVSSLPMGACGACLEIRCDDITSVCSSPVTSQVVQVNGHCGPAGGSTVNVATLTVGPNIFSLLSPIQNGNIAAQYRQIECRPPTRIVAEVLTLSDCYAASSTNSTTMVSNDSLGYQANVSSSTVKPTSNSSLLGRLQPYNNRSSSSDPGSKSPIGTVHDQKSVSMTLSFSNVASSASIATVYITSQALNHLNHPSVFEPAADTADAENITILAFHPGAAVATDKQTSSRNNPSSSNSIMINETNNNTSIPGRSSATDKSAQVMWTSMANTPADTAVWRVEGLLDEPAPDVGCYSLRLTDSWGRQLTIRCAIPTNATNESSYLLNGQFPPLDTPWINNTQLLLLTPSGELGNIMTSTQPLSQHVFGNSGVSQPEDLLGLVPTQPLPLPVINGTPSVIPTYKLYIPEDISSLLENQDLITTSQIGSAVMNEQPAADMKLLSPVAGNSKEALTTTADAAPKQITLDSSAWGKTPDNPGLLLPGVTSKTG